MTTVSLFCGAGGEQAGKTRAFEELNVRAAYAIAINHWGPAVSVHGLNHPSVQVFQEDITQVTAATHGLKRIHLLQASPSCVHHSRARGGLPKQNQERSHAWEVVDRWLMVADVDCFLLENVTEFEDWGPLDAKGDPIKSRKGEDFQKFITALRHLGYQVEWRNLVAADFGDPTTRRRLFLQAVKDGRPIRWPAPTHRNPKKAIDLFDTDLPPWRTAAECIDWDRPVPSIFGRKRPLAEATLRRIAAGMDRYTLRGKPFLVNMAHGQRLEGLDNPMTTITTEKGGSRALAAPTLIQYHATQGNGRERGQGILEPLQTVDTSNRYGLVAVWAAKHYGGVIGTPLDHPLGTVTAVDHHSLVAAGLLSYYGTTNVSGADEPLDTVTTKHRHGLIAASLTRVEDLGFEAGPPAEPIGIRLSPTLAFLVDYLDDVDLVTVEIAGVLWPAIEDGDEVYIVYDIGLRMLEPRELARAMSFPESFRFERKDGVPLTKADQVKMIGNACPVATVSALVKAMLEPRMHWFDEVAA